MPKIKTKSGTKNDSKQPVQEKLQCFQAEKDITLLKEQKK